MSITPPRDFWPPEWSLNGVLYANAPLSISSLTISIADASTTSSGVVNLATQSFGGAKNFNDGFTAGATQLITSVSTDSTFATATDNQLATKKAIKDYIATGAGSLISSVTSPLYLTLGNLAIYDASAVLKGVVTTTSQSFAGQKTFVNDAFFNGNLYMTNPTVGQIMSTIDGSRLYITSNSAGSSIETQSLAYGGHLELCSATWAGKEIRLRNGSPLSNSVVVSDTTMTSYRQTLITTATGPQLTLQAGAGTATFEIVAGGDLTINCSGNDLNFHSTDKVHVLNTTAATSKTDGALTVNGGLGVSGSAYADRYYAIGAGSIFFFAERTPGVDGVITVGPLGEVGLDAIGTTPEVNLFVGSVAKLTARGATIDCTVPLNAPTLLAKASPAQNTSITTSPVGVTTFQTTGTQANFIQNGSTSVQMNDTLTSLRVGTEVNGMLKYNNTPPLLTPAGAGSFDNYSLSATGTVYEISLGSVTSGAHFTGFTSATMYNAREVKLIFISASSKTIVIDHDSGSSTAANRVWCPNSANLTLTVNPAAALCLYYEPYNARWLVMTYA